jgi:Tyrosine phosphatase family
MRPDWIDLDGTANTRDVGGLPNAEGHVTVSRRLLRSDNLQDLTEADVRRLIDDYGVRVIADLRAGIEVDAGGPGPMTGEPLVTIAHLSLFPSWTTGPCRPGRDAREQAAAGPASTSGSWPSAPIPCWRRCA